MGMRAGVMIGTSKRRLGFTMIELLAVIAILAILMVILVSQLGGGEDAVKRSATRSFLGQLGIALDELSNDDEQV